MGCADSKPETWYPDQQPRAAPSQRREPSYTSSGDPGSSSSSEPEDGPATRPAPASRTLPAPAPAPPVEDKLPLILGRLQKPDADWDKWGINELTQWCRESIRARPHQSSVAVLLLSYENGALLDLVSESFNGKSLQSDAALRLRKGRVDIDCACALHNQRQKGCLSLLSKFLPSTHSPHLTQSKNARTNDAFN